MKQRRPKIQEKLLCRSCFSHKCSSGTLDVFADAFNASVCAIKQFGAKNPPKNITNDLASFIGKFKNERQKMLGIPKMEFEAKKWHSIQEFCQTRIKLWWLASFYAVWFFKFCSCNELWKKLFRFFLLFQIIDDNYVQLWWPIFFTHLSYWTCHTRNFFDWLEKYRLVDWPNLVQNF